MNAVPPTNMAIRYTRMLLIKTGLTEDEADTLIERIATEAAASGAKDESERLAFIEAELAKLKFIQRAQLPRDLAIGAISGVAANFLTMGIGAIVGKLGPAPKPSEPQPNLRAAEVIRAEWVSCRPIVAIPNLLGPWQRALKFHEDRDGRINPRTAVYLDAIGMLMDWHNDHRQAERMRRQAVKISEVVNGPTHESTASAFLNLGLCLHARGKDRESIQCLARSFRILQEFYGPTCPSTCAVVYDIYECFIRTPQFLHIKMPPEFTRAVPEIKKFGQGMVALKVMIVGLISLLDILQCLQAVGNQMRK